MIAIPVMLLSINSNDGENWWLKTVIRAAMMFGLLLLARIDAAAVLLGAMMVCSAAISLKLYYKSEAKQKRLAQQLTKAASAQERAGAVLFISQLFTSRILLSPAYTS